MRSLPADLLLTFSPPRGFGAHGFRLQYEALRLYDVEEYFADHVGITGVGRFEAGAEPVRRLKIC